MQYWPLDPALMARVCRECAAALRHEAANGWPGLQVTSTGGPGGVTISRKEAAESMDAQAARWTREVETGVLNVTDRLKLGFPVNG